MKSFPYTVRGHWPFPLDMLRRDGSRAATDADQALIDQLSGDHVDDAGVGFNVVDINLVGPNKPNTERWGSFGWTVPTDVDYQWHMQRQREANERRQLADQALAKLTPEEIEAVRWVIGQGAH